MTSTTAACWCGAPTGQAVDVAIREGAGDTGMTIAKALKDLRKGNLRLHPNTLVVVDEAAMVGTNDLRELLAATTAAGVKTVAGRRRRPAGASWSATPTSWHR